MPLLAERAATVRLPVLRTLICAFVAVSAALETCVRNAPLESLLTILLPVATKVLAITLVLVNES